MLQQCSVFLQVADWPSGAPGANCKYREYKEWIIVNLSSLYPSINAETNGSRCPLESAAAAQKRSSMSKCFSQSNRRGRDILFTKLILAA